MASERQSTVSKAALVAGGAVVGAALYAAASSLTKVKANANANATSNSNSNSNSNAQSNQKENEETASSSSPPPFALSNRAKRVSGPPVPYLDAFEKGLADMYNPDSNPNGYAVLAVAENKTAFKGLVPLFREAAADFPAELAGYNDMKGTLDVREAFARFMTTHFGGYGFDPSGLCLSAGCGAILDTLSFCFCNEGEALMLVSPYYPGFDNDVKAKSATKIVECKTDFPHFRVTRQKLDESWERAVQDGIHVKGILISNPSNPLGTCMVSG